MVWENAPEDEPFGEGVFGGRLDWTSPLVDVYLAVELPFWLVVPSSPLTVTVDGHAFAVQIRGDHFEVHAHEFLQSRANCVYLGPDPAKLDPAIAEELQQQNAPVIARKCKTILRVPSRAMTDAFTALGGSYWRAREAMSYFQSLAAAHTPVLNEVIQQYRLATYDYFPHEVSPWDVPIWFVQSEDGYVMVPLFPYAAWDYRPLVNEEMYSLITPEDLQSGVPAVPGPGELELLDGLMLMERGDYSGAVRRVSTAVEVLVEDRLRQELLGLYDPAEVESRLHASRTDFPGRLRQWQKLSEKSLANALLEQLGETRALRHEIVHAGRRLTYIERGLGQRCVDTARWIYSAIEGDSARQALREKHFALRSIGRFALNMRFDAEITEDGAVVYEPALPNDESPNDVSTE